METNDECDQVLDATIWKIDKCTLKSSNVEVAGVCLQSMCPNSDSCQGFTTTMLAHEVSTQIDGCDSNAHTIVHDECRCGGLNGPLLPSLSYERIASL